VLIFSTLQGSEQNLAELLAGKLANHAFHLQIEERGKNFRRVQGGAFDDVVDRSRVVDGEEIVNLFLF
jgi:hypothetical protein